MHAIQQHILGQLVLRSHARYSELKPADVEGNQFSYHLKSLLRDEIIEPTDGGYRPSARGLQLADTLSLATLTPRSQPKIVTLLAVRNDQGEWLLYRRKKEPFAGLVGFPYGKIHLGESIGEAARRELHEKTGLEARLRHVGEAYVTVRQGEVLVSHMLAHVFVGGHPEGKLIEQSSIGTCFWRDLTSVDPADAMPGFFDLARLIEQQTNQRFFHEFVYTL